MQLLGRLGARLVAASLLVAGCGLVRGTSPAVTIDDGAYSIECTLQDVWRGRIDELRCLNEASAWNIEWMATHPEDHILSFVLGPETRLICVERDGQPVCLAD